MHEVILQLASSASSFQVAALRVLSVKNANAAAIACGKELLNIMQQLEP